MISLERLPTATGELEPDCLVGLFCDECLRLALEGVFDGLTQSTIPVGSNESPDRCLLRQAGFAVVPLVVNQRESELMIEELRTEILEVL